MVTDKVQAFLTELDAVTTAHDAFFARGTLSVFPAEERLGLVREAWCDVDLDALAADEAGLGWGHAALALLTALADEHQINIFLIANADDELDLEAGQVSARRDGTLEQGDLVAWYERHGFTAIGAAWGGNVHMRRPPQPLTPERRAALERARAGEPLAWAGAGAPGRPRR